MDAALVGLFLKFAHNPASWIDESYRQKLASDMMPAGLLDSAWRKHEFSALLERYLDLGGMDRLSESDLESVAARIALMETDRLQDLLVYAGICFCQESLRKAISKVAINKARQEFGDGPVDFARSGAAAECLGEAPDNVKPPSFGHAGWSRNTAIAVGVGLWYAAAAGLDRQWLVRVRYKVPASCHELAEHELTRELPREYSGAVIGRVVGQKAGDLQWLQ